MQDVQPTHFDYGALSSDVAEEARAIAARVRSRQQNTMALIRETGRDLLSVKEKLGHGHFLSWIEAEFAMTRQTANNYMNVADRFGEECKTILHLPPAAAYALASPSTPEPIVRQVFAKYEAGEKVEPVTIKAMVKEAKDTERAAAKLARLKPAQRRYHRNKEAERQKADEDWKAKQKADAEAAEHAAFIVAEALGDRLAEVLSLLEGIALHRFKEALTALHRA